MDWLEKLKKSKPFLLITWAVAGLLALGGIAGAINSLIDLYERGFDSAGGWYATATGWLSSEMTIPVWFGLLSTVLLIILAVSAIVFLCRYLKPASESTSLPSDQHSVLCAIGICNHAHSYNPTVKELAEPCGLSVPVIERATEALHQSGLIKWKAVIIPRRFEAPQVLHGALITSKGRDYLLDAGIDPSNPSPGQGKI